MRSPCSSSTLLRRLRGKTIAPKFPFSHFSLSFRTNSAEQYSRLRPRHNYKATIERASERQIVRKAAAAAATKRRRVSLSSDFVAFPRCVVLMFLVCPRYLTSTENYFALCSRSFLGLPPCRAAVAVSAVQWRNHWLWPRDDRDAFLPPQRHLGSFPTRIRRREKSENSPTNSYLYGVYDSRAAQCRARRGQRKEEGRPSEGRSLCSHCLFLSLSGKIAAAASAINQQLSLSLSLSRRFLLALTLTYYAMKG